MIIITSVEIKIDITIEDGRIDYKELLKTLAEFNEIVRINTTEDGLRIISKTYDITLKIEHESLSKTRIKITGRTEEMNLIEIAAKMNELRNKILEAVKD